MEIEQKDSTHKLEAGQVWRLDQGYLYIVEMGKRHVHYKMLIHPHQRAALTRMIRLEHLLRYLQQSDAELDVSSMGLGDRASTSLSEFLGPWAQRPCATPHERATALRAEVARPPACSWSVQCHEPHAEPRTL
jgi:hypothetical protein